MIYFFYMYQNSKKCNQGPVSTWMGDCLRVGKPSRYVKGHLDQLSLPSLRPAGVGKSITGLCLGLRWGVFTCVRWQVTLCDPTWQVTLPSCEKEFH